MTTALRTEIDLRRRQAGLSWGELADQIGGDPIRVTSALLGQHPLTEDEAQRAVALLGLDTSAAAQLSEIPATRIGDRLEIPADPTLYRFYEALGVYGPAIRILLHEEFGDGIMSAINFRTALRRVPDPDGDRVQLTFDGKFLKYQW